MKNKDTYLVMILMILFVSFALLGANMVAASENPYETDTIVYVFDAQEQMDMEKYFEAYCNEIDSLCYSYGFEIDADRIDILNDVEMEEEAYRLLGDKFYTWRQRESKYAWIRDVFIARYCY